MEKYLEILAAGRGWRKKAQELNVDASLTLRDVWDIAHGKICPICNLLEKKPKETNIGRTHTCGSPHCAETHKRQKTINTSMERYGVDVPAKSDIVKKHHKQTNEFRYGCHPASLKSVQTKRANTNLKKYGCLTPASSDALIQFSRKAYTESRKNNYLINVWPKRKEAILLEYNIEALTPWNGCDSPIKWKHHTCGHEWAKQIPDGSIPTCPKCNLSKEQFGIDEFLSSIYSGEIKRNIRTIIAPYELDIYLPELKLGIELNGSYWHRDGHSTSLLKKYELCKSAGIKLIHIMDWEWNEKRHIVKSILSNLVHAASIIKLGARHCTISKVKNIEIEQFLNDNHIQGYIQSSFNFALKHNGEIIACLALSKPRWDKKHQYEITRWAVKRGVSLRGGFTKSLTYAQSHLKSSEIMTYSDLRWGEGGVYAKNGFTVMGQSKPNYWWVKNKIRLSRYQTTKFKIFEHINDFDSNLTEDQNMLRNGWMKISDCGNLKWSLNR